MTQQLFDQLAAGSPPSTVDVPAIIRREKRRRMVLRFGGSVAIALAAAGALVILGPDRAATFVPPVAAVPSFAAPAPPATGFRLVADDWDTAAATAASLRAALDAAVHRSAPGAIWLAQGRTGLVTPDGEPPRLIDDDLKRPADQMFWGATGIGLEGRRGTLTLSIVSMNPCTGGRLANRCPDEHKDPETLRRDMARTVFACQPAAQKCTASTRPDGRRQRVQGMSSPRGGFISQATNIELADGRALMILVDNTFIAPSRRNETTIAQHATPLTAAQITAIATAIGDQILP